MSGHTPGPWHVAGADGEWVNDERNMNVCRVNPDVSLAPTRKYVGGSAPHSGNANLIAAAPEFFRESADTVTRLAHKDASAELIDALMNLGFAVDKAKGQTREVEG